MGGIYLGNALLTHSTVENIIQDNDFYIKADGNNITWVDKEAYTLNISEPTNFTLNDMLVAKQEYRDIILQIDNLDTNGVKTTNYLTLESFDANGLINQFTNDNFIASINNNSTITIRQNIKMTSVTETNKGLEQKFWRGTKEEYEALDVKDEDTMYIVIDEEGGSVISAVQPDWNQNDETAPDYVKNRTHWEEDPVIVDNEITLEETTYEEFDEGYCRVDATTINFVEGANCVVTWDGIEYESVCGRAYDDTDEYYVLGNPMLLGFDEDPEDNGQPFGIVYNQSSKYLCFVSSDVEAFSHTVKITSNYTIQEFHKLDNKYIDAEWMAESPIYDRVLDIEETVLTGEPYDGVFIAFLWLYNFKPLSVMEKATFNIILDGVEYTSVSEYGEFGNLDLRYGNLNGGDPYYGVIQKEGILFTFPSEGDHTISLTADNFIYKQLPKEYLPTSVQGAVSYSEYQSLPIWAQDIARQNIGAGQSGKIVTDIPYVIGDETFIAKPQAEVFNDYNYNIAVGFASHAEGSNTIALDDYSHAEGNCTTASGDCSHAEGSYTFALGGHSHAEGGYTFAFGYQSHAEGGGGGRTRLKITGDANATTYTLNTTTSNIKIGNVIVYNNKPVKITAYDSSTLTITVDTTLSATEALSAVKCWMYYGPVASGESSHAEGYNTTASGESAHAEGSETEAFGFISHAEGNSTTASGDFSHAEGNSTTASGHCSHAEGYNTTASGDFSHAEGDSTTASGDFSHTEGYQTTASGNRSHAEGNSTTASGDFSHAEGGTTTASGDFSHAEGGTTTASGDCSHAEGNYTIASGDCSHAEGKYNIKDFTNIYAHIVGNGTSYTERSNAHTLDWNGNAWFAGDVYVGSTSGTNKDEGSKKLTTVADIEAHNTSTDAHTDIRQMINNIPSFTYGTEDLIVGVSELAEGAIYFVYEVPVISFTINNTEFTTKEGTTWAKYSDSVNDPEIISYNATQVLMYGSWPINNVSPTDVIVGGMVYTYSES